MDHQGAFCKILNGSVFCFVYKMNFLNQTICSYHITYAFQSESTLYSCLNVKELLARSRREIWSLSDCNWTRTHKQVWLNGWVFVYEPSGCGFESSFRHLNFPIRHRSSRLYQRNLKLELFAKTVNGFIKMLFFFGKIFILEV